MTYRELFEQLLAKGYQPPKCGEHTLEASRGSYCCARAVYDFYEDFDDDPAVAEHLLRDFLTLDAREVYRVWYAGQDAEWASKYVDQPLKPLSPSKGAMTDAFFAYRNGEAEGMIEFILQNP